MHSTLRALERLREVVSWAFTLMKWFRKYAAEADSPAAGAPKPANWEELARVREAKAQIARDRFRSAAESYDD